MRKYLSHLWISLLLSIVFVLSGCSIFGITIGANMQYSLTFHTNADAKEWTYKVEKPEDIRLPEDPVKENYIFDGWYWDDGVWEKPFTILSMLDQPISERMDLKVYAKWKGAPVTVCFDEEYISSVEIEYGAHYELPLPKIVEGDVFLGWELVTENGSVKLTDGNGKSLKECDFTDTVTLVPLWKDGKVTLSFDVQGGEEVAPITVWTGEAYGQLPIPHREGYEFLGWYTAVEDGEIITDESEVLFAQEGRLYARWEKLVGMKVTYDGNGATAGETLWQYAKQDEQIILRENGFIRDGYTFVGWEYDEKTYAPKEEIPFMDGEVVMKAVWQGISYQINFLSDRETDGEMASQTFVYGEKKNLSANTFLRVGYSFVSWEYEDEKGRVTMYTDGQEIENLTTADGQEFTFRAVWRAHTYTVLIKEEESAPEKYTLYREYNDGFIMYSTKYHFQKTGYICSGWMVVTGENAGLTCPVDGSFPELTAVDEGEVVVIPTWKEIRYTLKYLAKTPGSGIMTLLGTYELNYFEEHTLIECTAEREGYYGDGWTFEEDSVNNNAVNDEYAYKEWKSGDVVHGLSVKDGATIRAVVVWKEVRYTLRVHANDGTGATRDFEAEYKAGTRITTDWMVGKGEQYTLAGFTCGNQKLSSYAWDEIARKAGEIVDVYALWQYSYKGEGTEQNPYVIDCADAMENMAVISFARSTDNYSGGYGNRHYNNNLHFRFTADIDMTGRNFTPIGWYDNASFRGSIDGNGHTVYGLNVALPADKQDAGYTVFSGDRYYQDAVGFICEGGGGSIKNLRFESPKMQIDGKNWLTYAGFLAGSYLGEIENVSVINCQATVVGAGLPQNTFGESSALYVGGLVADGASILTAKNCYFSGDIQVQSPKTVVGGIVAYDGNVYSSAADVTAAIEGIDGADMTTATVCGIGTLIRKAKECYAVTDVYADVDKLEFFGVSYNPYTSTIEEVYYSDGYTLANSGAIGEMTGIGSMTADANLKNVDWVVEHLPSLRTVEWDMSNGYPIKRTRTFSVVEISTKEQMLSLAGKNLTEKYLLTADLDMSNTVWTPASIYGEFDGNGHTVYGLSLSSDSLDAVGLFAENYGVIKNVLLKRFSFVGVRVDAPTLQIGGIVGYNEGIVAYCGAEGVIASETVNGDVCVGGIAGRNTGEIYGCYASCTLSGVASELESRAIIVLKKGEVRARVFGIAYCEEGGTVRGCYTTGSCEAVATLEVACAGVSNAAENSFSFACLTYNEDASTKYVEAVGNGLRGCSLQTINGESVNGSSETIFKTAAYLTSTVGMQAWTETTDLSKTPYEAWKFVSGGLPKLYFE